MDKILKSLTSKMVRMKMETKQPRIPTQEGEYKNPNQFRRPNNVPQILSRERRNQEDKKKILLFKIMQWKKLKKWMTLKMILQCI
jgi:hypothetical protein